MVAFMIATLVRSCRGLAGRYMRLTKAKLSCEAATPHPEMLYDLVTRINSIGDSRYL